VAHRSLAVAAPYFLETPHLQSRDREEAVHGLSSLSVAGWAMGHCVEVASTYFLETRTLGARASKRSRQFF
jgi:hypothetical protein